MKLLLIALAIAGCAHAPPLLPDTITGTDMPANLSCVEHVAGGCAIYRSAQPTAAEYSAMVAKLGLRSVIKLNTALEARDELPVGVEPFEHPWLFVGPVSHDEVLATLYDLEHAPRPTLIHCSHGEDRTGLLVALWRVKHHVPAAAAAGEWRAHGKNVEWDKLLDGVFERETGYRP